MGLLIELLALLILIVIASELWAIKNALRDKVEDPAPPEAPWVNAGKAVAATITDALVGPTLPRLMSDEDELGIEQQAYLTQGAQSGYQVMPYWIEQEEREAMEEKEQAGTCSRSSLD